MKKNLILGYCVGLNDEDIKIFCESALNTLTKPTDIVIFANGRFECRKDSQFGNLIFVPTNSIWEGMKKDKYRIKWAIFYLTTKIIRSVANLSKIIFHKIFRISKRISHSRQNYYLHPALARYLEYLSFISANRGKYENVLISDVRDVYFQNDPFEKFNHEKFVTFLEPGNVTCSELRNRRWIKTVYGHSVAEEMSEVPVICSGVGLGKEAIMFQYLEIICHEITTRSVIPYSDQGIHNVLIHRKRFPAAVLRNEDALTLTAGYGSDGVDFKIQKNMIATMNGEPFAIIHQFDRHPKLENRVKQQLKERLCKLGL